MKKIMRRAAALCAAVIILASGCGSESEPTAVQDESTVETIEKIQIEIEYDGDEVLGEAIRKAADGFNESQDIYVASVGSAGTNLQELTASVVFTDDNMAAAYALAPDDSLVKIRAATQWVPGLSNCPKLENSQDPCLEHSSPGASRRLQQWDQEHGPPTAPPAS